MVKIYRTPPSPIKDPGYANAQRSLVVFRQTTPQDGVLYKWEHWYFWHWAAVMVGEGCCVLAP